MRKNISRYNIYLTVESPEYEYIQKLGYVQYLLRDAR